MRVRSVCVHVDVLAHTFLSAQATGKDTQKKGMKTWQMLINSLMLETSREINEDSTLFFLNFCSII